MRKLIMILTLAAAFVAVSTANPPMPQCIPNCPFVR